MVNWFKNLFASHSGNISDPIPGFDSSSYYKQSTFNWLAPQRSGKTELSQGQQKTLVGRAWQAYRNQDIARSIATQLKTSVIATGLKVNPTILGEFLGLNEQQQDELETAILMEFEIWSNQCDIERELDFESMQLLMLVNWAIGGECLINTMNKAYKSDVYTLKLQMIDAERLSNPSFELDTDRMYRGIEVSEQGFPIAYHIRANHPDEIHLHPKDFHTWKRVKARDMADNKRIFHLYEKERIGSMRGIPIFSAVMDRMKDVDRWADYELIKSVMSAWITFVVSSEKNNVDLNINNTPNDPRLGLDSSGKPKDSYELGPGAMIQLPDGKKLDTFNPASPNDKFEPYYNAMTRSISSSCGLPLEEVMLIFNSSFSASRAAMLKSGRLFDMKRNVIAKKALEDIYRLWFDEAVFRNALPHVDKEKYFSNKRIRYALQRHEWLAPGHGSINENDAVKAAVLKVESGLSDYPTEVAKMTGKNWKTVVDKQAKAKQYFEKKGLDWPFEEETKAEEEQKVEEEPATSNKPD